jgi:hypothetical protein
MIRQRAAQDYDDLSAKYNALESKKAPQAGGSKKAN